MQEADLKMNAVLQDVLAQLNHDTEDRNIEWMIGDLPNIKGDQALLRMVWYNLLGNAVKFTKAKDPAKIQIGYALMIMSIHFLCAITEPDSICGLPINYLVFFSDFIPPKNLKAQELDWPMFVGLF